MATKRSLHLFGMIEIRFGEARIPQGKVFSHGMYRNVLHFHDEYLEVS